MAMLHMACLIAVISAATAVNYNIAGYTQRYGDCNGNDIRRITRTTLAVCTAECNKLSNCKTFLFVDHGSNSYCWLKHNACPRLSFTSVRSYHFYNKIAGYSAQKAGPFFGYQWYLLLGASTTSMTGRNGLSVYSSNTPIVPGPHGLSAYQFQGQSNSYVKITNGGKLNFGGSSWTVGTFFYQTGSIKNGPIMEWRGNGRSGVHTSFGTHFWIWGGTLFTNLDASSGRSYAWHWKAPTANAWHFVGASYNADTGAFFMWNDNEVFEKNTGRLNALDQTGDVYIGIRPAMPSFNPLKAKLAGMTMMKGAISKSDIASFKAQIIQSAAVPRALKRTLLLDLLVVLDASSSTGSAAFNTAKGYLLTLLNTYKLGTSSLRIKLLYFNGVAVIESLLDNEAHVESYKTAIGNLRYGGGSINLLLIFQRISTIVYSTSASFYRTNVARSAFLIGGLSSGSDVQIQTQIALYFQSLSSYIRFYYFAIGVTKDTSFWSQNLGSQYIVTSLETRSDYVINWFVSKQTTLNVKGVGFTKKTQNLQLVLTLDGSTSTGRTAFYKTFNLILTLLRTQTIGGNGLKLYVIIYNGGQANVIRFINQNDVTTNLKTMIGSSSYYRYGGVSSNSITLLTKVTFVIQHYISQNQPRTVWLLGGVKVTDQRQTLEILKTIMVQYKVPLKYYGIGTQVDLTFWQSVLPTQSISTNVNVNVNSVITLTASAVNEAVRVITTGPVVKDIVKTFGETTTTTTTTTPSTTTTTPTTTTTTTKKPKRDVNRDVIVTLDSSSASGRDAFNKAKQYILTLLNTYKISRTSLRIYVIISSGTISVLNFDDESSVDRYVTLINQQTYRGRQQNILLLLKKIDEIGDTLSKEVPAGRPRSAVFIGGFPVPSNEENQFKMEMYISDLIIRLGANVQYFAIGVQTIGKNVWAELVGGEENIHDTIDTSENSVVRFFNRGQNDAGPKTPKQTNNMQIVLTLDSSSATGRDAFYKTLNTITGLLKTNNIGPNALQLFVVYYNGGAPQVIKFKSSADVEAFFYLLMTTRLSTYTGATPNTKVILETVKETVRTELSPNKPKTVWLLGGMKVTDQEDAKQVLLALQSEFKVFVYYFAIGVQQDTTFWNTVLDSQYVKTDTSRMGTDASFITNFIIKIYRVIQNVQQGPTITTIIKNVGVTVDMGVTEESPLQIRVVGNKYWVPGAINVNSPSVCPGGTTAKEGNWCEISDMDAFVTWAKTIGLTVTRWEDGNTDRISISGIIRRTQTVQQSGTLTIQEGALLPKSMLRNACPIGTQGAGTSCRITNVKQFMTWLANYGKEYGLTQS